MIVSVLLVLLGKITTMCLGCVFRIPTAAVGRHLRVGPGRHTEFESGCSYSTFAAVRGIRFNEVLQTIRSHLPRTRQRWGKVLSGMNASRLLVHYKLVVYKRTELTRFVEA